MVLVIAGKGFVVPHIFYFVCCGNIELGIERVAEPAVKGDFKIDDEDEGRLHGGFVETLVPFVSVQTARYRNHLAI